MKALSPIYRAMYKEAIPKAGRLEPSAPQVWHTLARPRASSATRPSHTSPSVCRVAIANRRLGSLNDRTVTGTYRQLSSARLRTTNLDVMEFRRRFLQHVWPEGFMRVRHFGLLHASCAISTDTLRRMSMPAHPLGFRGRLGRYSAPLAALCPTGGALLRVVMRLWPPNRQRDTG